MSIIYVIHPDKEELSKIRHILGGGDFILKEYQSTGDAESDLKKIPPDICLMPIGTSTQNSVPFENILHNVVADCPIIILTGKHEVTDAVKMLGDNYIYDYFLMHPIVDPIRLHIIIEKALTQSAVQLNLEDLKNRLASLPTDLPHAFEEQAKNLKVKISSSLNRFKEKMKGSEFEDVIKLLDENAFDDKFKQFENEELEIIIEQSKEEINDKVVERLKSFSLHVQQQIDDPPKFEELQNLRKKLYNQEYKTENLKQDLFGGTGHIAEGISTASTKTVLFIDDEISPTEGLVDLIENIGLCVLTANSPRKLLDIVKSQKIDMLICGYNLGNIDGIEIAKRIKEGLGKASLPVILLTNNPTKEIIERTQDVGIDEIVSLPLLPRTLQSKIENLLEL